MQPPEHCAPPVYMYIYVLYAYLIYTYNLFTYLLVQIKLKQFWLKQVIQHATNFVLNISHQCFSASVCALQVVYKWLALRCWNSFPMLHILRIWFFLLLCRENRRINKFLFEFLDFFLKTTQRFNSATTTQTSNVPDGKNFWSKQFKQYNKNRS